MGKCCISTSDLGHSLRQPPFLIGVAGQFGSGKDEFSNHLAEQLNNAEILGNWYRDALASNVKRIFMDAFGVDFDFVEKWKRVTDPPEGFLQPVRKALTFIGDGFRDIVPTIWIDRLLKNNKRNLVISDVRYLNEANYIRENNGIAVLLWRPGYENDFPNRSEQEVMPYVKSLKSKSDGEIRDKDCPFDLWIVNDGTLQDLYVKINKIVIPYVEKFVLERSRCC